MKKIVFFSTGFAFNRLVRMRYYEKIFPPDIKIFLITTDKYKNTNEKNYQSKWDLVRTKVIVLKYNPLLIPFEVRKFCRKNKVDILSNLGHPFGAIPLIIASRFTKKKIYLYFLGDVLEIYKNARPFKKKIKLFLTIIPYIFLTSLSHKIAFVGKRSYENAPTILLKNTENNYYLHAPINTGLFKPKNKKEARRKLKIKEEEKIILLTGKVTYMKGGDIISKIIKSNLNIKFIVIGKWIEKEVPKFKSPNLIVLDKIYNENLPKYYSAADLSFAFHRQGDQMGIVGGESLACGTPIIHTKRTAFKDSEAIIKVSDSVSEINKKIKEFFSKSKKQRDEISKTARKYAQENLSDEIWKEKYLKFFLG
ncbi:MAG: glycosyltransferase [Candidatus Pacearchaeota archaeon]|nr:glycosyltransferase [Candidatus Pacearchaeota archaeon]